MNGGLPFGPVQFWATPTSSEIQQNSDIPVPLNVLDTSVHKSSTSPLGGVLEISTEDGVLRLAISGDAAKDLKIDLTRISAGGLGARESLTGVIGTR